MASCGNLLFVIACQIAAIEAGKAVEQRLGRKQPVLAVGGGSCRHATTRCSLAALSSIRVDWTINARAAMRRETALEYAEALKAGAKFPPVTVFFDGSTYWLADRVPPLRRLRDRGDCGDPGRDPAGHAARRRPLRRGGQRAAWPAADPLRPAQGDHPAAARSRMAR